MRLVLALGACLALASPALAGLDLPASPGMSQADVQAAITSAMAGMKSQMSESTKSSTIPAAGPGAGMCRDTVVPSEMIVSGGVTGTAGTCSVIKQCGTDPKYLVTEFNVGGGC